MKNIVVKGTKDELKKFWLSEEERVFQGWDFSSLSGRWEDERLPWDYEEILRKYLDDTKNLLDMGTGGGEFLLNLNHPYNKTSVTEGYPPNFELCLEKLAPLGIVTKQVFEDDKLDFPGETFDIVINRHESFDVDEVYRVLKPDGIFVTQQVGGDNNIELSKFLIDGFEGQNLDILLNEIKQKLVSSGFVVVESDSSYAPTKFFDIGAVVYYAKIIEWEFPGFSVEKMLDKLYVLQAELEENGFVSAIQSRFYIVAKKEKYNIEK